MKGANVHQAALVAMRPDGRVVAMVGGANYGATPFNRATQALRQPGSSFKLFVYLAALHAGMKTSDTIDDEPVTIDGWSPKNDEGKYRGRISLATAFAASSNVAAAKIMHQVGVEAVRKQARLLGVTVPLSNYQGLALGTSAVPLIELTSAYAALANGSYPVKPVGLAKPRAAGLDRPGSAAPSPRRRPWPERNPMLELLQSAVRHGTGRRRRAADRDVRQDRHDAEPPRRAVHRLRRRSRRRRLGRQRRQFADDRRGRRRQRAGASCGTASWSPR